MFKDMKDFRFQIFSNFQNFWAEYLEIPLGGTVHRSLLTIGTNLGRETKYRGFQIDGPASSWPRRHGKSKSSWPSKNGFGHNSPGLSPILMSGCMVKDTIINQIFRAPGPHRADF